MLHPLPERIYLIGMPASGKSTVGRTLAERLHRKFYDTDRLIEQQEQCSIPDIFQQEGEPHFRNLEHTLLQSFLPKHSVISTGGGMPCFHNNMEFIMANGLAIFIDVPIEILAQRAAINVESRPLLHSDLNLVRRLESTLKQRLPYYQQAHITLTYVRQDPTMLTEEIVRQLQQAGYSLSER